MRFTLPFSVCSVFMWTVQLLVIFMWWEVSPLCNDKLISFTVNIFQSWHIPLKIKMLWCSGWYINLQSFLDSNTLLMQQKSLVLPPLSCGWQMINLLATDFFSQILAHPVFKMWVTQKPNKVALWNKQHFEGERMEIIQHV